MDYMQSVSNIGLDKSKKQRQWKLDHSYLVHYLLLVFVRSPLCVCILFLIQLPCHFFWYFFMASVVLVNVVMLFLWMTTIQCIVNDKATLKHPWDLNFSSEIIQGIFCTSFRNCIPSNNSDRKGFPGLKHI